MCGGRARVCRATRDSVGRARCLSVQYVLVSWSLRRPLSAQSRKGGREGVVVVRRRRRRRSDPLTMQGPIKERAKTSQAKKDARACACVRVSVSVCVCARAGAAGGGSHYRQGQMARTAHGRGEGLRAA